MSTVVRDLCVSVPPPYPLLNPTQIALIHLMSGFSTRSRPQVANANFVHPEVEYELVGERARDTVRAPFPLLHPHYFYRRMIYVVDDVFPPFPVPIERRQRIENGKRKGRRKVVASTGRSKELCCRDGIF